MIHAEIEKLYEEFHTPLHVKRHCKAVADFAKGLAEKMAARGIAVNPQLVYDAAMLHDLVRYVDFKILEPETWNYEVKEEDIIFWKKMRSEHAGKHHADVGADLLVAKGLPIVAEVVRKHNFLHILEGFNTWEEKLVYYADKRAKHDCIVPLHERLHDGRQRNQPHLLDDLDSHKLDKKVAALEAEILAAAGVKSA